MDQNMAIAELRARADATDDAIQKLDERVTRHDEIISQLREAIQRVATKDDMVALREDINGNYADQLKRAQDSTPMKATLFFTGAMFLLALITLVVNLMHGHG